jgi:ataxia telangiectasia mutated family protein
MKPDEVQGKIKQVQEKSKNQPEKQLELFLDVRKKFRPVLRHYFTEKHKVPIPWFTMRLNYIRSVATTSIVGHVLGLGDRHVSNILLDNVTGEVVHIDLGIAFDQVVLHSFYSQQLLTIFFAGQTSPCSRTCPFPYDSRYS